MSAVFCTATSSLATFFWTRRANLTVADFGLARFTARDTRLTLTHAALGSPAYMAPEQAAGKTREITTAADIYALGAILYEMLAGRPPFVGETAMAVTRQVVEEEPPNPSSIHAAVPLELAVICLKCLEKEPSRRYASASALADDLDRWLRHVPILARAATVRERLAKWVRRKPMHAALTATLMLACAALFTGLLWHNRRITLEQRSTEAANHELARQLRQAEWQQAEAMLEAGRTPDAMARFARFLRETPDDTSSAMRLRSILGSRAFPIPILPPLQHDSPVARVRLDPQGRFIWTITVDGVLRTWSRTNGLLQSPAVSNLTTHALEPFPDGNRLLLQTKLGRMVIWDVVESRVVHEFGVTAPVGKQWALSENGNRVATLTPDRKLELWDSISGGLVAQAGIEAEKPELPVRFDPDGSLLVHGRERGIWLWRPFLNQASPELIWAGPIICPLPDWVRRRLYVTVEDEKGHGIVCVELDTGRELARHAIPWPWHTLQLSPDGARLLASRWGIGATMLDTTNLQELFPPVGASPTFCVVSPDQSFRTGFQALHDGSGRLYDLANGQPLLEPVQHSGLILAHELSSEGDQLVTASQDGVVQLWDVRMRAATDPVFIHAGSHVLRIALSPDGQRIATALHREARIYDRASRQPVGPDTRADSEFNDVCFSPDGKWVAGGTSDGSVCLLDSVTGRTVWRESSNQRIWKIAFSPNGRLLAAADEGGATRILETATGQRLHPPFQHAGTMTAIAFSSDSRLLATASYDATARVWNVETGQPHGPLHRHKASVYGISISPDDQHLVTASRDRTAQIWSVASGERAGPPIQMGAPVSGAHYSKDGRRLLIYSLHEARVFDVESRRPLTPPMLPAEKNNFIHMAAFSPNERWVATACDDGSARIWDARSGFPVTEPLRHGMRVFNVAWLPDSRELMTGSFDRTIRLLRLPNEQPAAPWLAELAEALAGKREERDGGSAAASSEILQKRRMHSAGYTGDAAGAPWFERLQTQP